VGDERIDVPAAAGADDRPRARGRPARISRDAIIGAARTISPDHLTMQKVADVLGVNPKALNYHVGGRDGLRQMVALDVFEFELGRVTIPGGEDWRAVVRAYVAALRNAIIKLGALALSMDLPGSDGLGALGPVERVLQALVDAGLGIDEACRALIFITDTAYAAGRDALRTAEDPVHPQFPHVATALEAAAAPDFPVLRQVVAWRARTGPDEGQFEFGVDLLIAGLERTVASRSHPSAEAE
jgi:TetR/AcrR family tetracycline transcriptional repressor